MENLKCHTMGFVWSGKIMKSYNHTSDKTQEQMQEDNLEGHW